MDVPNSILAHIPASLYYYGPVHSFCYLIKSLLIPFGRRQQFLTLYEYRWQEQQATISDREFVRVCSILESMLSKIRDDSLGAMANAARSVFGE